ncbi:MAG: glutathione S-transferase family protein [Pseudomonadota bacterium]
MYGSAPSPCARRVRITLLEKKVPFDEVEVDLVNMEQRSEAYLRLNPNGFVPTLAHGSFTIFESAAIVDYLEEQFPQSPLVPADPWGKAQVRMWQSAEGAMAKIFRPLMYQRLMGPVQHLGRTHDEAMALARPSTNDPQDLLWEDRVWKLNVLTPEQEADHERRLFEWLAIVEQALQDQTYMVGGEFSQADIALFPRILMYPAIGLPISPTQFPNTCRWMTNLQDRPSFVESEPEQSKKIRKLASAPIFTKIRLALATSSQQRTLGQRGLLWLSSKLFRKLSRTDQLLRDTGRQRVMPMPVETKPESRTLSVTSHSTELAALELFGDRRSPHSRRIGLLLNQLGIEYQWQLIDLAASEHKRAAFRTVNPLGEVPALRHQCRSADQSRARTLYDSLAIAEYVTSAAGSYAAWFGDNSEQAARSRMWLALEAGSHKEFKPLWQKYVLKQGGDPDFIGDESTALNRLHHQLGLLEEMLTDQPYLCGSAMRYADLAWYTRIESLLPVPGFALADFPHLANWYQGLAQYFNQEVATA